MKVNQIEFMNQIKVPYAIVRSRSELRFSEDSYNNWDYCLVFCEKDLNIVKAKIKEFTKAKKSIVSFFINKIVNEELNIIETDLSESSVSYFKKHQDNLYDLVLNKEQNKVFNLKGCNFYEYHKSLKIKKTIMNNKELDKILLDHKNWMLGKENGKRADLKGADLKGADLTGADLTGANLTGANLTDAILTRADLTFANLKEARLIDSDLAFANLTGAILTSADLTFANLKEANLKGANLIDSDLALANLTGAILIDSDLKGVSISVFCKWALSYKNDLIRIGCKEKTIEDWDSFFESNRIYKTKRDTEDFKRIRANYEALKTYLNIMKK